MSKIDFEKMSNPDLVRYARQQGHNTRGLSRERIMDLLIVPLPKSIALPDEEATLCAMRTCPNRISVKTIGSVQTVLAPKEKTGLTVEKIIKIRDDMPDRDHKGRESISDMSWALLRSLAKANGIKTHGKKRPQVEAEIKEKQNG